MLVYHHCVNLEHVIYGALTAKYDYHKDDEPYGDANSWLEKQVGFYPLFLAVGMTEEDIRMTGYQNQWERVVGSETIGKDKDGHYISKNILRKKGEFPNHVLFSFKDLDGKFLDYMNWFIVLNSSHKNYDIADYEKKLILKPSWPKSKWLRKAKDNPHSVMLVTSKLYLPDADRIWVRNKKTKHILEKQGFDNVEVKRILVDDC